MDVLLVSATSFEVENVFPEGIISGVQHEKCSSFVINGNNVDLLITGPGMVATSLALGNHLAGKKYDFAINAGIAGSFDRGLRIGEVVNVVQDCIDGFGADSGGKFIPLYTMKVMKDYMPPFLNEDGSIRNKFTFENSALNDLKAVAGITVNTITGSIAKIEEIQRRLKAEIESMEGAAFFWACHMYGMQCFQIRAISNYVEERNLGNWDIPHAINNLGSALENIFNNIGS